MTSYRTDLLVMLGGFAIPTGIAELAGATNLGTALAFGQLGFAGAVVWLLVGRK